MTHRYDTFWFHLNLELIDLNAIFCWFTSKACRKIAARTEAHLLVQFTHDDTQTT